jgi:hypothetical protein
MFKLLKLILFITFLLFGNDYEDAITRRTGQEYQLGIFEGFYVDTKYKYIDSKTVEIYFILENLPSAYFESYDSINNILTIEFYDVMLGESQINSIYEYPILKTECSDGSVDLNEGVVGFAPDVRKMTKLKFFFKYKIDYTFTMDEYYLFHLKFKWDKQNEKKLENTIASKFNEFILIFFAIGLITASIYFFSCYWYFTGV